MVSNQFEAILKEFSSFFNCSLTPDENNSCHIKVNNQISIQLELDRYGLLLVACRIASLPMSRYRDHLVHAALKFNEATLPLTGIFGFGQKSQQFILFIKLDPQTLSPYQIALLLPPFIAKAKQWIDAIAKGEVPSATSQTGSNTPSGLFGLIS